MKRDSLVFAISGTFFGLIVGWILGTQSPTTPTASPAPVAQTTAPAAPPLDTQRIQALEQQANANPTDPIVRADLGNLYFDGERFDLAVPWYEASLALSPDDVNVSTDLAVCYFYIGQTDRALAQIDRSLAIDANHVKTIFNQGIIRSAGKSDLTGATESFQRVVALAPDSEEGRRARDLLEAIGDGQHGGASGPAGAGSSGG